MDRRTLAIATGLAKGLNDAVSNYTKIKEAKAKLKQNEEAFNINMKLKEAQLKEAEERLDPFYVKAKREEYKNTIKLGKLEFLQNRFNLDKKNSDNRREIEDIDRGKKIMQDKMKGMFPDLNVTQKIGDTTVTTKGASDELTPFQQEQGKQRKNKAIGGMKRMLLDESDSEGNKFTDEVIISSAMAGTGLDADWLKNKLQEIKSRRPTKESLFQKGKRGLSNIFNF